MLDSSGSGLDFAPRAQLFGVPGASLVGITVFMSHLLLRNWMGEVLEKIRCLTK